MTRLIAIVTLAAAMQAPAAPVERQPDHASAVFVAYYWRAKPGQLDAYNDYIKTVAVPIDEDARRAGAFEEVRTVTPAPGTSVDWTHLRIFRVKSADAAKALGAALDAATARVVPDEARRKANGERAETLRDAVRQEMWMELR